MIDDPQHQHGTDEPPVRSGWSALAAPAVLVLSLAGLAALQYGMPNKFPSIWGTMPDSARYWDIVLFGHNIVWSDSFVRIGMQALVATSFLSWIWMVLLGVRRPILSARRALALVAAVAVLTAIFFPPTLSADVYAYVSYARLSLAGRNPYVEPPRALSVSAEDELHSIAGTVTGLPPPTVVVNGKRLRVGWNIPSVYGPVWTIGSAAALAPLVRSSLWVQVCAFKLVAALALVLAAWAAGKAAQAALPAVAGGRAALVLAVGLNPVLVIEGAGSGHNDILMIALLLTAAALLATAGEGVSFRRRRAVLAALALGASVAVKVISVLAALWLIMEAWRRCKNGRAQLAAAMAAAIAAPTAIGIVLYWNHGAILAAITQRTHLVGSIGVFSAGHGFALMLQHHHGVAARIGAALADHIEILATFAAATVYVAMARPRGAWMAAWCVMAGVAVVYLLRYLFPWYAIWLWPILACRRRAYTIAIAGAALTASALCTFLYTVTNSNTASRMMLAGGALYLIGALVARLCHNAGLPRKDF